MARLYLAESHRDKDVARRIARGLGALGHVVSWDDNFLVPGVEWRRASRESLARADGLVVLLSNSSLKPNSGNIKSQWISADVGAARATGKFVIPVVIGNDQPLPSLLNDLLVVKVASTDDLHVEPALKEISAAIDYHIGARDQAAALALPPGYQHLAPSVLKCREDAPFETSVFVMMKFPDPNVMSKVQCELLSDLWDSLSLTLAEHGLRARRADKREYEPQLWENICVYMLSCRMGIAILEDRIASELNPNVTLEYGFMKALNRQVAIFRDVSFKHDRADLTGKLSKPFTITTEERLEKESLKHAVRDWLIDLGIPRKQH